MPDSAALSPGVDGGPPGCDLHPIRIAHVTNSLPHYRVAFYRALVSNPQAQLDVHVDVGDDESGLHVRHAEVAEQGIGIVPARIRRVPFIGAHWQKLQWRKLLREYDVLVVSGDARGLSNVALATLARLSKKPVVIVGQLHTAGPPTLSERLRHTWLRTFNHLLFYTDDEAERFQARHPHGRALVLGLNNGLDHRAQRAAAEHWTEAITTWQQEMRLDQRPVMLSVARVIEKNRFDLMVEALPRILAKHPDLVWVIVGEGAAREALECQARSLGVAHAIRWIGPIHTEEDLAPWFMTATALIHPGAIGLSLLHAFGYGLPVITHSDPIYHMPEFAAFKEGRTGRTFRRGDWVSLAETVLQVLGAVDASPAHENMSEECLRISSEAYNCEVMAERWMLAVEQAAQSPSERSGVQ